MAPTTPIADPTASLDARADGRRDRGPAAGGPALYRYGLSLGLGLAARGQLKRSLRYLVLPVNYWRTLEFRLLARAGAFHAGDRVLDIGSPKLFSLYLAERIGADVYPTDIEDYFIEDYQILSRLRGVSPSRFHPQTADGRDLRFPDAHFTKVYSISVLEHIPADGDSRCAAEIGRVLAPGGRAVLTVPFAPESRDEYTAPRFYWHRSSAAQTDGTVFYQRRYSEAELFRRLIQPSGLRLRQLAYVGERVLKASPHELCEYLPRAAGPLHPLLSRLVHTEPVGSWQALGKPLCALIVLER